MKYSVYSISYNYRGNAIKVRVGLIHLKASDPHVQDIVVSERIPHPKYSAKTKYNDIALLKLAENIKFNEYVRPACLNTENDLKWTTALASGFGRTSYGRNLECEKEKITCKINFKYNLSVYLKKAMLEVRI